MKIHPQKNTLLQAAQGNAETKACKRVFFSPTQENFFPTLPFLIKLFSPTHRFIANTTSYAFNVNRFEQSVCGLDTTHLRTDSRAAHNIRLNEIFKKGALVVNQTFVHLMKCVQVQKMRTTLRHKFFNYLFAFFASTVLLRIPLFKNFVKPLSASR